MSERTSVTSREAVLASLLAHACFVIYVLLFPDTFRWSGRSPFVQRDRDAPIPLEFLQQEAPPARPPAVALGDAGDRQVSEPRPETAPPATREDPYSAGNTRNRFVAPPIPERARPAPEPGPDGDEAPLLAPGGPARRAGTQGGEGEDGASRQEGSRPEFYIPQRGGGAEGQGDLEAKAASLRAALGRMSLGMTGGAPLKFDNPAGGLSGPMGGLSFDTPGFDWGPYARRIYWVIWSNWVRGWPPAAWAGLKGVVTVRFRIWRDGRITDITVIDSSGTPAFDTCATLALEASSPLPPLPDDFLGESEGIAARFLYNTGAPDL